MSLQHPVVFFCLCLGVGLLGVLGSMTPIFSDAEESIGLHVLYALRGPIAPRTNVTVVGLDSESAAKMNLPLTPARWPRAIHAKLIDRLSAEQTAAIVFDMIFHEPQDGANDQLLSIAMQHAGNVVLTQTIDSQSLPLAARGESVDTRLDIERVLSAVPGIADAAVGQAPFPLPKVPIKLNQFWCFRKSSGNTPTLPVVVMHVWAKAAFADFLQLLATVDAGLAERLPASIDHTLDTPTILGLIAPLRSRFEQHPALARQLRAALVNLAPDSPLHRSRPLIERFISLYAGGSSRFLNLYGPSKTIPTIAYHRLLDGTEKNSGDHQDALPPLKDAAVFVGQSGSNWIKPYDGFYTVFSGPSGKDIGGVEIAATAFANLVEGKAVHPFRPIPMVLLMLVWGAATLSISMRFGPVASSASLLVIGGLYLTMASMQFNSNGSWYPLVVPLLVQSPAAFITGLIVKYRRASTERKNIREAFGHYLPDAVVDRLSANMKTLKLGGQVFYGICLFTDAQNYTTLSESLDPDALTRLMNTYYEAIFRPIKANGGLVLQVVGDSVLAIWTAAEADETLKQAACRAAVGILGEVANFNHAAGDNAMPTRIGIHAGEILLGNIGAIDHFEYRPVGDIVNTASRLEGLNKFLGTCLLVSDAAMAGGDGIRARALGRFVFKGKSQPVNVMELQPVDPDAPGEQDEIFKIFTAGLDAFRQRRWTAAHRLFTAVLSIRAADGPARFYRDRCRVFQETPPEETWDGSVHLERK